MRVLFSQPIPSMLSIKTGGLPHNVKLPRVTILMPPSDWTGFTLQSCALDMWDILPWYKLASSGSSELLKQKEKKETKLQFVIWILVSLTCLTHVIESKLRRSMLIMSITGLYYLGSIIYRPFHHIAKILMIDVNQQTKPESTDVRLELQERRQPGLWTNNVHYSWNTASHPW